MNKNQLRRRAYLPPTTCAIGTSCEGRPLCGSFEGGHGDAVPGSDLGDGGDNGHENAGSGGSMGDTRKEWINSSLWD
ncbi:hypothetical protein [Alloprevotella rava]|uniref:hypothetical protein n=1 Tax=Alloprevotella rava TaxID=671218 RepID=UPI000318877C|nr:hypothetical protein [Alloprevotella rava]